MSEASPDPSTHLEPPSKTTEREDPGAEDSGSESGEEHFSDASEGHIQQQSSPRSGGTSPVPRTRIERVDSSLQHGEVPGTVAYEIRQQDAVPDEIEVIPEGSRNSDLSPAGSKDRPVTPTDSPIPRTMVEKVDPDSPSYGEVPGTEAFEKRLADAVPDVVKSTDDPENIQPPASSSENASQDSNFSSQPIPETRVSRVDSMPNDEDLPSRPQAHHRTSPSDAMPDVVETVPDTTTSEDTSPQHEQMRQDIEEDDEFGDVNKRQAGADEFDDFVEEQDDMSDDDFGDFDDGFQEPSAEIDDGAATGGSATPQQPQTLLSVPPLIDLDTYKSTTELLSALEGTLDNLFPASQDLGNLSPIEPIPDSSAIFSTERSLSLWSQLVAPPPLQPQNWVKSRIRRLFLVSLGVPVDLDEILPASKQKKLVLPSIDLDGSGATTPSGRSRSQGRKEGEGSQNETESAATTGQAAARQKTVRRGAVPPPEIDLSAVHRLCATTDAALSGLTDVELQSHVKELEKVTLRASTVLEYWLKRRDGLISEKEAFEGVIENLVSHVRRVRK
ncbi:hypothetical protein N7532_003863 [Penicillium argentinense]|uniref:Uncharacterized protein n=1 Tax=Penicillium argentinense TaxID=1131581 RepID=A0A9W9KED6_9EURO|nr:uncharacterized protein N7532_003863 [Penicillium argentinense]KAJ5103334.1 hypothetical protein N7532_003863 [Penicillium argentinense]